MKKLSKKTSEFIEFFLELKNMDSITIERHDMNILYNNYKYSWSEFDKLDKENQRLNNIINELKKFIQKEIDNNLDGIKSFSGYQCKIILDKIKELENDK